ncbi:mechanosensitive ion channel family protein [Gracilibacillus alcaliphilus]|uniref:mechanosensitive ion channel family protein n=1 Tax=Gracilibacillus alcaliphilus TaxID=1401441 RepID=UPI00195EDFAC|nr:mechanosensitive ion channel family protein [Gracilibacillus alcaliphilus]MBM7675078.1 MscS family membrane protein [Gracilibacillus alcaliphilus]
MNLKFWESITVDDYINLGISIAIILIAVLFRKIFIKYVFYLFIRLTNNKKTEFLNTALKAFETPLRFLFVFLGIYIAMAYFPFINQKGELVSKFLSVSIIITITWWLCNLSSSSSYFFKKLGDTLNFEVDQILLPFLSKAVRFVIIAISLTIIAQEFGYDVSGFIAGLGLGGLAFALAAQEVIKNLFGGVVIITEKPFSIGDWIMTPSIEGTVEDINFRSTIIRTFEDSLVTIPNSTLSNEPITNWSQMNKRRISFDLRLTYDTTREELDRVLKSIESYLEQNEAIHPETIFVKFNEYGESSIDVMLYFFTKTTVWEEHLNVKEEVNFKILEILEQANVSIAYPARSVYMNEPKYGQEPFGDQD